MKKKTLAVLLTAAMTLPMCMAAIPAAAEEDGEPYKAAPSFKRYSG